MLFNTQIKKYEQLPGLNYVDLFWSSGIKFSAMICLFRMEEMSLSVPVVQQYVALRQNVYIWL